MREGLLFQVAHEIALHLESTPETLGPQAAVDHWYQKPYMHHTYALYSDKRGAETDLGQTFFSEDWFWFNTKLKVGQNCQVITVSSPGVLYRQCRPWQALLTFVKNTLCLPQTNQKRGSRQGRGKWAKTVSWRGSFWVLKFKWLQEVMMGEKDWLWICLSLVYVCAPHMWRSQDRVESLPPLPMSLAECGAPVFP